MALTIDDIRNQLRLEADDDSENQLLESLLVVAQRMAANYCDRTIYWEDDRPADPEAVPSGAIDASKDLEHGVLMMAGHLYEHREAVTDERLVSVPFAIGLLWGPYRRYSFGTEGEA